MSDLFPFSSLRVSKIITDLSTYIDIIVSLSLRVPVPMLTLSGRYRITEGSEEIQMRKIAAYLFGYVGPRKAELSKL